MTGTRRTTRSSADSTATRRDTRSTETSPEEVEEEERRLKRDRESDSSPVLSSGSEYNPSKQEEKDREEELMETTPPGPLTKLGLGEPRAKRARKGNTTLRSVSFKEKPEEATGHSVEKSSIQVKSAAPVKVEEAPAVVAPEVSQDKTSLNVFQLKIEEKEQLLKSLALKQKLRRVELSKGQEHCDLESDEVLINLQIEESDIMAEIKKLKISAVETPPSTPQKPALAAAASPVCAQTPTKSGGQVGQVMPIVDVGEVPKVEAYQHTLYYVAREDFISAEHRFFQMLGYMGVEPLRKSAKLILEGTKSKRSELMIYWDVGRIDWYGLPCARVSTFS